MPALLPPYPAALARAIQNRIASAAYPKLYQARARLPRYNLQEQARQFHRRAAEKGFGDLSLYYWYHTVDLGDGLVTPGSHDYRGSIEAFGFADDMSGMRVLDIGSATGFFAFEFESRGAEVVSVEVPSLEAMDRFPNQQPRQIIEKIAEMTAGQSSYTDDQFDTIFNQSSLTDFYEYFVDGPFRLCHKVRGSQVLRRYATVYDLPQSDIGSDQFDLVFLGDLLLHTMHPVSALAAAASLCAERLVISQYLPLRLGSRPAALYSGGDDVSFDHSTWWFLNFTCFEQVLKKLGFRDVRVVGRNTGVSRPNGSYYDRSVIHAVR